MRILGLLGLAIALPVSAQNVPPVQPMPAPAQDYSAMSDADLLEAGLSITPDTPPCAERYPIMSEMAARTPESEDLKGEVIFAEIWCAEVRGDYSLVMERLRAFEAMGRTMSPAFGLYIAAMVNDGPEILARMRHALLEGDRLNWPEGAEESFRRLDADWYYFARRRALDLELRSEVRAIEAEAAVADHLHLFDDNLQEIFARSRIYVAVTAGELPDARAAVAGITNPVDLVEMLGMRKFEPVWPELQDRAGAGFGRILPEYRDTALARHAASPDDIDLLQQAAHALYYAGDYARLIALVDAATSHADLAQTLQEDEAWALNLKAYSLDALGRRGEADAVLDFLAEHSDRDAGWAVNFVINRASRLVGQERWEEGLEAARLAKSVADVQGSPYAKMLVARDHACALTALGRLDEAAEYIAFLRDNSNDDPGLAAVGMLCAGREDEAATLVIGALRDEAERETIISRFQPEETQLFYTPSELPELLSLLETRPEVQAEFEKHARIIPEEFYPAPAAARARR